MKILTVHLLLDVSTDAAAYDAGNEILRDLQFSHQPASSLIDYAYAAGNPQTVALDLDSYEEGEFTNHIKDYTPPCN